MEDILAAMVFESKFTRDCILQGMGGRFMHFANSKMLATLPSA
ncbi:MULTISPECIES: hypothetical protein [Pseudomonas]|nr:MULTISPECIES: hypothetical protein [Pseudomonas]MDR6161890.1 hypothetical protein [Pseudomonas fluorescens]